MKRVLREHFENHQHPETENRRVTGKNDGAQQGCRGTMGGSRVTDCSGNSGPREQISYTVGVFQAQWCGVSPGKIIRAGTKIFAAR